MKLTVTIDRDEDGTWVVECPSIPGCVSQGHTKEEALANIREAIELCLEVRAELGMPLTIETRQAVIVGSLILPIPASPPIDCHPPFQYSDAAPGYCGD